MPDMAAKPSNGRCHSAPGGSVTGPCLPASEANMELRGELDIATEVVP